MKRTHPRRGLRTIVWWEKIYAKCFLPPLLNNPDQGNRLKPLYWGTRSRGAQDNNLMGKAQIRIILLTTPPYWEQPGLPGCWINALLNNPSCGKNKLSLVALTVRSKTFAAQSCVYQAEFMHFILSQSAENFGWLCQSILAVNSLEIFACPSYKIQYGRLLSFTKLGGIEFFQWRRVAYHFTLFIRLRLSVWSHSNSAHRLTGAYRLRANQY
jgi:hypothetical protein